MNPTERKAEIKRLRAEGESYTRIAKLIGVSRQRIHQIDTGYSSYKRSGNQPKRTGATTRHIKRLNRERDYQLYLQELKRGSHFA